MDGQRFANICRIMMNIDKADLVEAGIMHANEGGNDWRRFNDQPFIFVVKLDDVKLAKLWALIEAVE